MAVRPFWFGPEGMIEGFLKEPTSPFRIPRFDEDDPEFIEHVSICRLYFKDPQEAVYCLD